MDRLQSVPLEATFSRMTTSQERFDAVVIGAGVVGCGIAYALGLLGRRVALVERGSVGGGTSRHTFAWVNATSKVTDPAYFRLNLDGAVMYRELGREFGEHRIGLHPTGMLEWANPSNRARLNNLRERVDVLNANHYPARLVAASELRALEPQVHFADDDQGLYALTDTWLDVPTYLGFLVERIRAQASTVLEDCPALELIADDHGAILGVTTAAGRLSCDQVVIAVGPDTPEVMATLTGFAGFANRFPMQRAPGLLVTTPGGQPYRFANRILYSSDASPVHLRETPDGGLLIGAEHTDGLVWENDSEQNVRAAVEKLLDAAKQVVPAFPGAELVDACQWGIGVRPVPADERSIVGPMPGSAGLYVACTHSGVTLSLILGNLLAETMVSGKITAQLQPFGFGRFESGAR